MGAGLCCLHSAAWWRRHWERTGILDIDVADTLPDGWQLWRDWQTVVAPDNAAEIQALEADRGAISATCASSAVAGRCATGRTDRPAPAFKLRRPTPTQCGAAARVLQLARRDLVASATAHDTGQSFRLSAGFEQRLKSGARPLLLLNGDTRVLCQSGFIDPTIRPVVTGERIGQELDLGAISPA